MLNHDQARIHTFEVSPLLPKPLEPLLRIAHNLWWSWHPEAVDLFVRLDRNLWEQTRHNPVRTLGACAQEKLDAAARDEGFLTCLNRASENLDRHAQEIIYIARMRLGEKYQFLWQPTNQQQTAT